MKYLFYIYIHIFLSSDVSAQGQMIARKKEEIYKIYVCRTRYRRTTNRDESFRN